MVPIRITIKIITIAIIIIIIVIIIITLIIIVIIISNIISISMITQNLKDQLTDSSWICFRDMVAVWSWFKYSCLKQ